MFSHKSRVRRHERKVLRLRYLRPRFMKHPNGDVTQNPGEYYSRDFTAARWSAMMNEFRHPDAHHNFVWTTEKYDTDTAWPRTGAVCTRCGDKRKISMFIDLQKVNQDRWCIK